MMAQNRALEGDEVLVELMAGDELLRQQTRVADKKAEKAQDSEARQRRVEISATSVDELDEDADGPRSYSLD